MGCLEFAYLEQLMFQKYLLVYPVPKKSFIDQSSLRCELLSSFASLLLSRP